MLNFIMKQLTQADAELPARFKEESKVWSTKATDLDGLNKKYNETTTSYLEAKGAHDLVTGSGEGADNFTDTTGRDLKAIKDKLDDYGKQVQALKDVFVKLCDFFQVEAKSDMRSSTLDFFIFFKRFCKEIDDNCPKEVKKRAGASSTAKVGGAAAPPSFHAEMMKQLAAKNK